MKNRKHPISWLLALACFMTPAMPLSAKDQQINFDQGVKVSEVLESIREVMLHDRLKAEGLDSSGGGTSGLGLGMAHSRLQTYLSNNAALKEMAGLLRDPRMERLAPELQQRLRAEGADLTAERDGMLPEARGLDAEDTKLAARRDELIEDKRKLDERLADINRQVAEHEQACLPTHPPERHQWCVENARRLNAIIDKYNADVRTHNAALAKWRDEVALLKPRWDSFVKRILAWEAKVKALIESIRKAFQEFRDCTYRGGSSEIIRLDPIESKITCKYDCCGLPSENYRFFSGVPTQAQIDFICTNPMPICPAPPAALKCDLR